MKRMRIIWAVAAKDIVGAIKNKDTLMVLIAVLFIVGFYRVLPTWIAGSQEPYLPVYDAGNSQLAMMLDSSDAVQLRSRMTEREMREYLSRSNVPELGLVIPADFDRAVANGEPLVLEGYVMSWVSDSEAAELQQFAETLIAELIGAPVEIPLAGNRVEMQLDSFGGTMDALGIIFVTLMIGLSFVPQLILEEKKAKTMDALLLSPAGPFEITMGKAMVGLFYGVLTLSVALGLDAALITQWWLAVAAALCGTLFTIALGLLLGTLFESQQQLRLWGMVAIMPLFLPPSVVMLGEMIPAWIVHIARWVPTSALLRLLRISFTNHSGWTLYGPPFAWLLFCTAAAMALVVWQLRRLER